MDGSESEGHLPPSHAWLGWAWQLAVDWSPTAFDKAQCRGDAPASAYLSNTCLDGEADLANDET